MAELSNPFPAYQRALAPTTTAGAGPPASQLLTSSYKIADIAIAVIGVIGAYILTNLAAMPGNTAGFLALRVTVKNLLLLIFFAWAWSVVFRAFGLYRTHNRPLNLETVVRLLAASSAGSSLAILFVVNSRAGAFGHGTTLVFWLLAISSALTVRLVLNALIRPTTLRRSS